MRKSLLLVAALAAQVAVSAAPEPRNYYPKIAERLVGMLPRYHVLQKPLDNTISRQAWTNLITFYDFDHSVFVRADLQEFERRADRLDDELRRGDVSFGYDVHNRFVTRLGERLNYATNLLAAARWDFSVREECPIKCKDLAWPEDAAAANERWRLKMKNEVLMQRLNRELDAEDAAKRPKPDRREDADAEPERPPETPEANLVKKYRQYAFAMTMPDEEAVLQHYLSAVARAYDPHTDYMSPAVKEDFDMEMNLTLCGVGAVLSMDDGALKIVEVMPGGPIDRDGRIREGDRIVGVRQEGGELEDVTWKPMHKSIQKIRGKKGTRVTLEILPRSDPSGATRRLIELERDEIKLEDQAATGRVERVERGHVTRAYGYVRLPGFYGTMDRHYGEDGFRSCAMDVSRYIADFNAEGVAGMVLDLRGNGGGALREAVLLSALFVHDGPVVQVRDSRTVGALPIPSGNRVAFTRPLVVLVDRASASASEIVAGHLQDVGRAVVLGDGRTHGKGTVQTVMGLGPEQYGSTKITTARFYRINGRSTQVEGVASDLRLPSLLDSLDIGEDKLSNALPFTKILPAEYDRCWNLDAYVSELKARSERRLKGDAPYQRHLESVLAMKAASERERVPLELKARKAQMRKDRDLRELSDELGEDDEEEGAAAKRRRKREQAAENDVVLKEALQVLADLVELTKGAELPPPRNWWE